MMTPMNPVLIDGKYPQQLCATSLSLAVHEIRKDIGKNQLNVDASKSWYVIFHYFNSKWHNMKLFKQICIVIIYITCKLRLLIFESVIHKSHLFYFVNTIITVTETCFQRTVKGKDGGAVNDKKYSAAKTQK